LLKEMPAPRLRAYPAYTVITEKLHAIAVLGMTNSRLKDYFDLSVLLERETLDAVLLAQAIKATFERLGMSVPYALPVGLTDEFALDASRQSLWLAFQKKNELQPEPLQSIVSRLSKALARVWTTVER
jgi:Nucleotidyl transferase AbiEii toxin, Type IV TA system